MASDALEPSLSEHGRSLERQVKDLNVILNHLLACINETRGELASDRAKISRCAALAASAQARAELAVKNAREAVPIAREAALEELLRIAEAANGDGPRHAEPKRHLRVVHGAALAALGGVLLHWTPKRAVIGAALTVAGIGATLSPGMLAQQAPAMARPHSSSQWLGGTSRTVTVPAPVPGPVVPARKCRDRDGDHDAVVVVTLAGRVCRERDGDHDRAPRTAAKAAAPAPSPAATPAPSPTAALPLPSTSPLPVPSPACTAVPMVTPPPAPAVPGGQ